MVGGGLMTNEVCQRIGSYTKIGLYSVVGGGLMTNEVCQRIGRYTKIG